MFTDAVAAHEQANQANTAAAQPFSLQAVNDIQDLNLSFLLVAQRLLAENPVIGRQVIGIDAESAEILLSLDVRQIRNLSSLSNLVMSMKPLPTMAFKSLVRQDIDPSLQRARTAMAMSFCSPRAALAA